MIEKGVRFAANPLSSSHLTLSQKFIIRKTRIAPERRKGFSGTDLFESFRRYSGPPELTWCGLLSTACIWRTRTRVSGTSDPRSTRHDTQVPRDL